MIPLLPNPRIIDELYEWSRLRRSPLPTIPEEPQSSEITPQSDDEPDAGKNMVNF